jgi:predicted nucleic acid-binding protein
LTTVDSSVVVAALTAAHPHHQIACDLLVPALERDQILLHSRVLMESYSVLTRIPTQDRLPPKRAAELLAENFRNVATVIRPDADQSWQLLARLAERQISGGTAYDAEIALETARAGATRLLTLNVRHFLRVAPPELEILGPALG